MSDDDRVVSFPVRHEDSPLSYVVRLAILRAVFTPNCSIDPQRLELALEILTAEYVSESVVVGFKNALKTAQKRANLKSVAVNE